MNTKVGYIAKGEEGRMEVKGGRIHLPHSCDEWIIGGLGDVAAFERDLASAKVVLLRPMCGHCDGTGKCDLDDSCAELMAYSRYDCGLCGGTGRVASLA